LGLKLFLSYLVIILVGVLVLAVAAQGFAPTAFARHTALMRDLFSPSTAPSMIDTLFGDFRQALTEAILMAAGVALLAAIIVSYFVSRRILDPIREMMAASREMVAGRYSRRVRVSSADELGALASNFNAMAETLEKTEERRRQLIADVAHELRTPLATIKSYMEGLTDAVLPADPATFELVSQEANRLGRLVQDLQDLSRVEAHQLDFNFRPAGVTGLVKAAVSRLEPQYQAKNVLMKTSLADSLPRVLVDADRVMQVLLNLLGNALQYTPAGGQVRVEAARRGEGVQVSVSDTGIGISPEHLSQVFERFYRVDKSRSRVGGGSGLGLTIARHIVEAHSGRIWAESAGTGCGSRFSFTLPVCSGSSYTSAIS
jgi:histidine kinase